MIDRRRSTSRAAALLVAVLAVIALVLAPAAPASAHASLIESDPAEGAVLEAAPEAIELVYNESVSLVPDGVQVFDATGEPVASTATARDTDVTITLDQEVGDGTLVLVWRVVSADGHPITGSLTFSVGAPSDRVEAPPVDTDVDTSPPWTLSLAGWVGYAGLLVAAGLLAFVVLFLPAHHLADKARRRLVGSCRTASISAAVAWLVALPLTAMYQTGVGPGELADGSTWSTLTVAEYAVPVAVVVGVLVATMLLGDGRGGRSRQVAALVASVVAATAPALTGHTRAATPELLAVAADMLHLVAGSVWLGGLLALVLVLPDLAGRGTMAAEVLARFSTVAAGVLVALVATGSLLAWRIAGSWEVLFEAAYGRLLLVKIGIAAIAVAIATANRFLLLPRINDASKRRDRREGARLLVRSTGAEAGLLVAVLLLTGFLVDQSPEPAPPDLAAASREPVVRTTQLGDLEVRATLEPPVPGPATVTLELFDEAGQPTEGFDAPTIQMATEDVDLGAIEVESLGPGVYEGQVIIPTAGTWELQVSLRLSEFDNPVASVELPVNQPAG